MFLQTVRHSGKSARTDLPDAAEGLNTELSKMESKRNQRPFPVSSFLPPPQWGRAGEAYVGISSIVTAFRERGDSAGLRAPPRSGMDHGDVRVSR